MPAGPAFGITMNWDQQDPAGYSQEVSRDYSAETATIKNYNGTTAYATNKPRMTVTVTAKGKGQVDLRAFTIGDEGVGGYFISNSKYTENQDDFPTSEITVTSYQNT
jgi:hypothetical protein